MADAAFSRRGWCRGRADKQHARRAHQGRPEGAFLGLELGTLPASGVGGQLLPQRQVLQHN